VANTVVQPQPIAGEEVDDEGGGGQHLGQRRQVVDGSRIDRRRVSVIRQAARGDRRQRTGPAADFDHRAREHMRGDSGLQDPLNINHGLNSYRRTEEWKNFYFFLSSILL
jgi:hypothetical protein